MTNRIGTLREAGEQAFGFNETERRSHGPPLSFVYVA